MKSIDCRFMASNIEIKRVLNVKFGLLYVFAGLFSLHKMQPTSALLRQLHNRCRAGWTSPDSAACFAIILVTTSYSQQNFVCSIWDQLAQSQYPENLEQDCFQSACIGGDLYSSTYPYTLGDSISVNRLRDLLYKEEVTQPLRLLDETSTQV